MQLVILTTGAVRRRYLVEKLQARFPIARVLVETRDPPPPYPTAHPLDDARKTRERDNWYDGNPPTFESIADVQSFENLNEPEAVDQLQELKPDVLLVFGTGRLSEAVLRQCPAGSINFHNGDAEAYRGLDCHLWPLFHGDFDALRMTMHKIEPTLDTGAIIDRRPVPLRHGMPLSDLRRAATELTVEMALDALDAFQKNGAFAATPQVRSGRYYSYIPAVLKDTCIRKFARHTATL